MKTIWLQRTMFAQKRCNVMSQLVMMLLLILVLISSFRWNATTTLLEYNSLTTIEIQEKLEDSEPRRLKQFIVFLIPSKPEDKEIRELFRSTWMNVTAWNDELSGVHDSYLQFRVMFILGENKTSSVSNRLIKEIRDNNDMFVFEGAEEHRSVLRYKVHWGLSVARALFDFSYIVKLDTDTFVDLPKLIKGLMEYRRSGAYTGECGLRLGGFGSRIIPHAKEYTYCSGGGYILSRDLVYAAMELESAIRDTHIVPEDAYIGWLMYHVRQRFRENGSSVEIPQLRDDVTTLKHRKRHFDFHHWMHHRVKTYSEMRDMYRARFYVA